MDDLISRQAALNELHLLAIEALRKQRRDYCAIIDICSNKIKSLPAVQSERKTGCWINDKHNIPRCSCCSYIPEYSVHINDYYYSDYCQNCGAKMGSDNEV